jgi:HD-GYP domain-containing protein (c-di-GMP phosphodiesterase class II)
MEKLIIKLFKAKHGMKLADTVKNENGEIIIYENTILTASIIDFLRMLDINKISIYLDGKILLNPEELFDDAYNNSIKFLKNVFTLVNDEKILDEKLIDEITNILYDCLDYKKMIIDKISKEITINEYIYNHTINVALMAMLIAKWLNNDETFIKNILKSSVLHDIGMIKVPKFIQDKENRLSDNEFKEIMKHPVYGFRLIKENTKYSNDILSAVLMHHEKEDGSGYPVGLKSDKIHFYAKILIVADVYNAMISKRSYRTRHTPFKVLNLFKNESIGVYDQKIIKVFLDNIASHYIGAKIMLSDGQVGEVVHINEMSISKPIVKINDEIIDISKYKDVEIVQMII